jgi:hypothetical protein
VAVGCATAAALIGGCGTGSTGHSGKADARQAIALAVRESAKITSLTMVETVTMRGLGTSSAGDGLIPGGSPGSGGAGNGALTARVNTKMRLKPTLLAAMSINMHLAGKPISIEEILTSRAIYIKVPGGGLPTQAGKPWAKISLASLPNGINLRKLFEKMQNGNPLTAMGSPKALAKFLASAKHLRVIGDQTVGGVTTTEYAGILNRNALMAAVPAAQKKVIRSSGVTSIPFRMWIDRQHHMRKMTMRLAMGKASMSLIANITSINAPVRIVPPPASQVSTIRTP